MCIKHVPIKAILAALSLLLSLTSSQKSDELRLYEHIKSQLQDTHPNVRPVRNSSHALHVDFHVHLFKFIDLDERPQMVTIHVATYKYYTHQFVSWNASDYGDIKQLALERNSLWIPDLLGYTRVEDIAIEDVYDGKPMINNTGSVDVLRMEKLTFSCELDMKRYPFDMHTCQFNYSVRDYTFDQIKLEVFGGRVLEERPSAEFNVTSFFVEVLRTDYAHEFVSVTISLERRSKFLLSMIYVPMSLLYIMSSLAFLLQVQTQLSVMSSLTVYSLLISEQVPPSTTIPLAGGITLGVFGERDQIQTYRKKDGGS